MCSSLFLAKLNGFTWLHSHACRKINGAFLAGFQVVCCCLPVSCQKRLEAVFAVRTIRDYGKSSFMESV
jgi:hypothetical protein